MQDAEIERPGAASAGIELAEIADHPHLGPLLAAWHVEEWGHLYEDWTVDVAETEFRDMDVPGRIPITWLAFDGPGREPDDVLGSISLLSDDDLDAFRHLHPWLASLYVVPEARGRGVGKLLVDQLMSTATDQGIERVHLFTSGQEEYYAKLGWRTLDRPVVRGHDAALMVRHTHPFAPRRAVASTWLNNPDIASAYSYLRPGGTPADRDLLAEPVAAGLHLAGEATWSAHPGTMHGAWFSGERAAVAVLAEASDDSTCGGTVIVIGAGLAGLGAARALESAGHDVTILEVSSTAGGRARTDTSLGGPVHLGPAWLHGEIGNPIAAAADLVGVSYSPTTWSVRPTFVLGHGRLPEDERARLGTTHDAIEEELARASEHADLRAAFGPLVRELIERHQRGPLDRTVLDCWFRIAYEGMYAATLDDLSLAYYAEPFHLPGHNQLLEGSLARVVDHLAEGLDIRYGQRVVAVRSNAAGAGPRWTIDTETASHSADAVIVTTPAGALQAGRIRFDPPLPAGVSAALDRIGPGRACKVFVTFDEAFWAPERAFWLAAEKPVPLGLWIDVSALAGRPTLCGFATSNHVATVEAMTEDELCTMARELLQQAGVMPQPHRVRPPIDPPRGRERPFRR
jgi:monoamine oxidase/GNAT superfamily N-acetyltransferase